MRRKTHCMKEEMKTLKAEAYECLTREKEKVKHELHPRKMQTIIAKRPKGVSIDLRICPCLYWQEQNLHKRTMIIPMLSVKNSSPS